MVWIQMSDVPNSDLLSSGSTAAIRGHYTIWIDLINFLGMLLSLLGATNGKQAFLGL